MLGRKRKRFVRPRAMAKSRNSRERPAAGSVRLRYIPGMPANRRESFSISLHRRPQSSTKGCMSGL